MENFIFLQCKYLGFAQDVNNSVMIRKFSDLTHVTALSNTINCNISNLFTHCVCMGVYVCVVCVRVCVRIFFST